jgi:Kdo2-lipid IVA lauroyltransferase/acyltransferase
MLSRFGVALLWLLHWLPLPVLAKMGHALGYVLYPLAKRRRHIALTNLALCFPEKSEKERKAMAKAHFAVTARAFLDRSVLWWGSANRIRNMVRIEGLEHMTDGLARGEAVILLVPHFVGLDAGGARLAMETNSISIYSRQKDPVFDRWLYHGRTRFGDQKLLSRQEGVRATLKGMKEGRVFFYLPDLDYGARDSIFVPFFGVPAATITALSRLTRLANATVLPCIASLESKGRSCLRIFPPLADFPSDSVEADTRRMNAVIEGFVLENPEQYYWVHRRFKTRPPGEAGFY